MTFFSKKLNSAALCLSLSVGAIASPTAPHQSVLAVNKNAWLVQQINQHPDIISAQASLKAAFSSAEGQKKALYNPELSTDVAREGDFTNFTVGISQTIDLWDKRAVRSLQADASLQLAQQNFNYLVQEKTAQALQAIITWQAANKLAVIAAAQEQQLGTLLDLVAKLQKVGDLGQVDAELTFLSLSQTLNETAQAQVRLKQAQAQLAELLPDWTPKMKVFPAQGLPLANQQNSIIMQQWLAQHPLVLAAKAQWQANKGNAQQAQLTTKADPTIGLNAGKDGGDNSIGLTFSMPLNVRNNFSAEARAANQQAIAAEANYRAVFRQQKFAIQASLDTLNTYQKSYQRWSTLMQGRGKRSENLLQKQWQSGDMSTTQYLLALQQRASGLNAGIELQSQFKLSQIDWLLQVGQINNAVKLLVK
ncbi:MAG: TolC family protein [Colwellia sp.]|nr:TolC family protein [Colwellia sp.]